MRLPIKGVGMDNIKESPHHQPCQIHTHNSKDEKRARKSKNHRASKVYSPELVNSVSSINGMVPCTPSFRILLNLEAEDQEVLLGCNFWKPIIPFIVNRWDTASCSWDTRGQCRLQGKILEEDVVCRFPYLTTGAISVKSFRATLLSRLDRLVRIELDGGEGEPLWTNDISCIYP